MSRFAAQPRLRAMGTAVTFEALRPHLMGVAYRMLGSAADAEDAVQDAWLRWQGIDESEIVTPKAWLSTALGRICLDRLGSAYHKRQSYVGPWLPEPVETVQPLDKESISVAFLLLLERLSPVERVAFVLHQVFDYSHAEIASALGSTDAAVRQAFHRARRHIDEGRPRFAVDAGAHERLLRAFLAAVLAGDIDKVSELLVEDAVVSADSDGKVRGASRKPVHGRSAIARLLMGFSRHLQLEARAFDVRMVNGWPALVSASSGVVDVIINIETDGEHIFSIRNVVNPDKLRLPRVE